MIVCCLRNNNIKPIKNEEFYLYRHGDSSSYSVSELHQRKNNCRSTKREYYLLAIVVI